VKEGVAVPKDPRPGWFAVQASPPKDRRLLLSILAFAIPLGIWCVVSYVPFIWHPLVFVTDPGQTYLSAEKRYEPAAFREANQVARDNDQQPAEGYPANPVFLPDPHQVATALYEGFTKPPQIRDAKWLHESVWHSIQIIFWGFSLSVVLAVPLGLIAGTFWSFANLIEPPIDFVRYMPAPVFGPLLVAVMGIADAPKISIIFIGTFFQMVLVVANTTRTFDKSLLETAQTLGASRRHLLGRVIIPGIAPDLYNDLRILLGWAWTYLIVAELIGTKTGITGYINQQSRYFNFDLVFAAILVIGLIGLTTDQVLQWLSVRLFPWRYGARERKLRRVGTALLNRANQWIMQMQPNPPARAATATTLDEEGHWPRVRSNGRSQR
jgi:NitT/TauT family transport system permease protein